MYSTPSLSMVSMRVLWISRRRAECTSGGPLKFVGADVKGARIALHCLRPSRPAGSMTASSIAMVPLGIFGDVWRVARVARGVWIVLD